MEQKNFVFFGTPDVASRTLELLKENGFVPSLVVTAPDRPVGRKQIMTPPPAKIWAMENTIPFLQPEKLDEEFIASLDARCKSLDAKLFIVVAYGKIMPQAVIDIPRLGTINIHYSLLPRWRGASPVEAAILAGDTETGIAIQQMVFKLDAGPIIAMEKTLIKENETAPELRDRLIELGGTLLVKTLPSIFDGSAQKIEQDHTQATHCKKIEKEMGEIQLSDPDIEKWHKYKAYFGWPGIFYFDSEGKRIKITKARFENNTFIIEKIIPEGGKEISW